MARPRDFDADIALDRAMQAFWVKGFKATSFDGLCHATGLSRVSLYADFGGKANPDRAAHEIIAAVMLRCLD